MKKLFVVLALLSAVAASSGCEPAVEYDPGYCNTEANFNNSNVDENYVRMVCMDWAYMLLQNCVSLDTLPLYPTETEVALYCEDQIEEYGSLGFSLEHSCNFIDNPNYECTQYAAQSNALIVNASFETQAKIGKAIRSKPRLNAQADRIEMQLRVVKIKASELK